MIENVLQLMDESIQGKLGICLICFFCIVGIFSFAKMFRNLFCNERKRASKKNTNPYYEYDKWD
jgi:hypothetical protein